MENNQIPKQVLDACRYKIDDLEHYIQKDLQKLDNLNKNLTEIELKIIPLQVRKAELENEISNINDSINKKGDLVMFLKIFIQSNKLEENRYQNLEGEISND